MRGVAWKKPSQKKAKVDERDMLMPKTELTHGVNKGGPVMRPAHKKREVKAQKVKVVPKNGKRKYVETNINDAYMKERVKGSVVSKDTVVDQETKLLRAINRMEQDYSARTTL